MIRVLVQTEDARRMLKRIQSALEPAAIDPVVGRVGLETLRSVVEATPKRWFGQVRRSWQIEMPTLGSRVVRNDNKIMRFLEFGTANAGQSWIYPKTKKMLYIPLNRRAALGWNESMVRGVDYILRRRVRGIKPRRIVAKQREIAAKKLLEAFVQHIRRAVHG